MESRPTNLYRILALGSSAVGTLASVVVPIVLSYPSSAAAAPATSATPANDPARPSIPPALDSNCPMKLEAVQAELRQCKTPPAQPVKKPQPHKAASAPEKANNQPPPATEEKQKEAVAAAPPVALPLPVQLGMQIKAFPIGPNGAEIQVPRISSMGLTLNDDEKKVIAASGCPNQRFDSPINLNGQEVTVSKSYIQTGVTGVDPRTGEYVFGATGQAAISGSMQVRNINCRGWGDLAIGIGQLAIGGWGVALESKAVSLAESSLHASQDFNGLVGKGDIKSLFGSCSSVIVNGSSSKGPITSNCVVDSSLDNSGVGQGVSLTGNPTITSNYGAGLGLN